MRQALRATGDDPAARWSVFRNMGTTYLYKVLPDGSEARDDDDEFPHLDSRDNVVLGYAVHRFKDPYAAWLFRVKPAPGADLGKLMDAAAYRKQFSEA